MPHWKRLEGVWNMQMRKSPLTLRPSVGECIKAETLRRQIGDILNRNTEPQFLRLALTKLAVLEQVYWEQHQKGGGGV